MYIEIQRDRFPRSSNEGARFRVKVFAQPGAPALLASTRNCGSVARAKRDAEAIFGALAWRDNADTNQPDLRATAFFGGTDARS